MRLKGIILLSVAGMISSAFGQTTRPAGDDGQYVGVVDGMNVYVRHNASMTAYPCTKLFRPQRVTVVGEPVSGWLKILPPEGVFSVIAKEYVQPDQSGQIGTVTGDNVWVRAGGQLRQTSFFGLQRQLDSGQKVKILGEIEVYYKIQPPEGVYFYISERYIRPLEAAEAHRRDAPTAPAPAAEAPATSTVPSTAPATEAAPRQDEQAKALAELRAAEDDLAREFRRPPAERDIDRVILKFKAIKLPPDSHLKPYVDYYLAYLELAIEQEISRKKFEALVRRPAASQVEYDMRRTALEVKDTTGAEAIYAAQGVLVGSAIYTGKAGAKRHLLRDPKTGAIVAYVEPAGREVQLGKYVGKYVGILGATRYDAEMQAQIAQAQQVVVLAKDTELPAPPRPIVSPLPPMPKPATKPAPVEKPLPKLKSIAKPVEKPAVEVKAAPAPAEKAEPKPAAKPTTKPAPKPTAAAKLNSVSKPASRPTTRPSAAKLLPPSGLPIVKPTILSPEPIDEEEFD